MNIQHRCTACASDPNSGADRTVVTRLTFVFVTLFVLFLPLTVAKAQTGVNYRFLEVVDTAGRPVVKAKVETERSKQETDDNGVVKQFPIFSGDFSTTGLKVSKPGYLTYESDEPLFSHRYWYLLREENLDYDPYGPIRIELLKMPATSAERNAFEIELRRRELLQAAKLGDAATVQRLLQGGVSANTADANGIPALLWAATGPDAESMKALLGAGAVVLRKDKPGRKVLLYYVYYTLENKSALNEEVVRGLLKAGADVNAVDINGETSLMLAKQAGNVHLVRQLESAGARPR